MERLSTAQGRIKYIDVARSIAIISITINHAVNRSFSIYSGSAAEMAAFPAWLSAVKVMLYIFSRVGVPIFLMITGALLLPRDYEGDEWKRFLKHNWLQLLITTEIWLVIMFWYKQLSPDSVLHTEGLAKCVLRFVTTLLFIQPISWGNMWYMYMILGLYLMIPLFSVGLKKIHWLFFAVPACIVVFCSFAMTDFNTLLSGMREAGTSVSFSISSSNVFSMYAIYILAGYFISQGILERVKTGFLWIGFFASFLLLCGIQYWLFGLNIDVIISYPSFLLLAWSVFLFELLRRARIKDGMLSGYAAKLAEISFGIFFVHICIMEGLEVLMGRYMSGVRYLPRFLILELVSFFGAILIIQILRRNQWMAKNLFGIKPVRIHTEA